VQALEDKTFGIKNKKGAKGQKYVQQVKQSMEATANKGKCALECLAGCNLQCRLGIVTEMLALHGSGCQVASSRAHNSLRVEPLMPLRCASMECHLLARSPRIPSFALSDFLGHVAYIDVYMAYANADEVNTISTNAAAAQANRGSGNCSGHTRG
jgi:hypothetical protein